ncbi:D-glycero-alpha-D-manno-heptose-1,7-bisphosphate 7-phosphatase [Kitasatospora phosalacinea]|uniref:D-glycero-alpha-D-manno-heptose-1,7-bisphosphate 7-phosphatase n=1 Tax=Kitasatospora phosalacinea TaxID=2065 RepID=UPI0009E00926|nr:HAD-IIIA family hydrolase [Kitasatospora phosalacinea]
MEFTPEYLKPLPLAGRRPPGGGPEPSAPWVVLRGAGGRRSAGDGGGAAVLLDRDTVLIEDIAYNGDPGRVYPRPGARQAVAELRSLGVRLGVLTEQPGVARGVLNRRRIETVHHRIEELFGPFDVWAVCPHGPAERCGCRKPAPGLVLAATRALRVPPARTTVIGGTGADLVAAAEAGARGLLVPAGVARAEGLVAAGHRRAADLPGAVRMLLAAGTAR